MTYTVSPTVDDVIIDLRTFVTSVLGSSVPCIKGIANRVPAPLPASGFVVLTPIHQQRLEFNTDTWAGANPLTLNVRQSVLIDIQLDVYGPHAGSWAAMLATLFRDDYACALMLNSQPLYMDEGRMIPLIDSESQYEQRWSLVATIQFNPVVQPAQSFADSAEVTLVDVEEAYPPE